MSVGVKRAVFGLLLSTVALGVFVLAAFWLLAHLLDRLFGWGPVLSDPLSQVLGATALLVGVYWVTWSFSYLVFVGKGLPAELFGVALHPTKILVTTGPYAYVRNPSLIGMLFIGLGVALVAHSLAGIILVPIVGVLSAVYMLIFEEKTLERRFGADYEEYRHNVPLLIPRMNPYTHPTHAAG